MIRITIKCNKHLNVVLGIVQLMYRMVDGYARYPEIQVHKRKTDRVLPEIVDNVVLARMPGMVALWKFGSSRPRKWYLRV